MGYFRGVVHGMAVGTVIGVLVAPQEGTRTRAQLSRAVEQARGGVHRAQETARTLAPKVQVAARTAGEAMGMVRDTVDRMRHTEDSEPYVSVDSGGNGHASPQ